MRNFFRGRSRGFASGSRSNSRALTGWVGVGLANAAKLVRQVLLVSIAKSYPIAKWGSKWGKPFDMENHLEISGRYTNDLAEGVDLKSNLLRPETQ